mgnify:CR=1 FL=1
MLPSPGLSTLCWHDAHSQELIVLFPAGMAKEDLIESYVTFLRENL